MRKAIILTGFSLLMGFQALALPPRCPKIYKQEKISVGPISANTSEILNHLEFSRLAFIFTNAKETKITWQTFETLKGLSVEVEKYAAYLKGLSSSQLAQEKAAFIDHLDKNPALKELFQKMESFQKFEYLPTEYELRKRFVEDMIAVLKLLPTEFRPRVAKINWDQRRKSNKPETEKLVQEFFTAFDKNFELTGFKTYEEYVAHIKAIEDPIYKKAIEILEKDQLDVVMRKPLNGRYWVPKVGFQNQFVTASSKGMYNPNHRNNVESKMTGKVLPADEYAKLDAEVKPKYATIAPSKDSTLKRKEGYEAAGHYGEDAYYFKKSDIQNRLSFTFSDSFGFYNRQDWTGMFIPWSRRLLMIPFIVKNMREKNEFWPAEAEIPMKTPIAHVSYWEAQIFGRLDLNMVEAFEFTKTPPEGEFLNELKKRNITIYDGRVPPVKIWDEAEAGVAP